MANIGLTNTPLIKDLYTTSAEALSVALSLGITGYRTYEINGSTVYVPGSTYIEYEKALQLKRVQGTVVARGDDTFGSKLVGLQFANSKTEIKGDPFLTLGNFSIKTSSTQAAEAVIVNVDQPKKYTAQTIIESIESAASSVGIEVKSGMLIDDVVARIDQNLRVKVNFDKRNLENYVLFSSLKERMRHSIQEITQRFPASMHIVPISIKHPTILQCEQHLIDVQTIISVNTLTIINPFLVDYNKTSTNKLDDEVITPLRNFSKTYNNYNIWFNGVEYAILNAILPTSDTEPLRLVIDGLPFDTLISQTNTLNVEFYIKPNKKQFTKFFEELSDLSSFLMNGGVDGYVANLIIPIEDDNGDVLNELKAIAFPMYDMFNIDIIDSRFDDYLTTLNNVGDDFDRFKTNLVARFLTTESLKEFDTDDRKFNVLLQVYGRMFDQVKQYIDGLTYMRNVSYDKVENVPDALVKNFARMLGLKTFEIQDEDTLIKSLFNFGDTVIEGDLTPIELDIEIWRRVLANAFYLFKNKGTRKSIEFVMELIGVPAPIIEINEYVYIADERINPAHMSRLLFGDNLYNIDGSDHYPYDTDGFPTTPKGIHFQADGGNLRIDKDNLGPYDFGKKYIDKYKKFKDGIYGFDLIRTVDNQKSWVSSTTEQYRINNQDLRHTNYYEKDSRLVVNSKEIDVFISLDRVFDVYPYRFFAKNGVNIDSNLSQVYQVSSTPNTLTFDQYLTDILNKYINVRNRKTIQTYPTLSKIYFDYLVLLGGSESYINFRKSMEFLNKFDSYWIKFVEQFLPATAIVNAGKKIDNSIHFQNKFKHRHGKNIDVNWSGTDGSEFQNKALKPSWVAKVSAAKSEGVIRNSYHTNFDAFIFSGKANLKYTAYQNGINDYFGIHYSFSDYCEYIANIHIWSPTVDYFDYQLNKQGVFVIHNNNLFRLPSNVGQNVITGQEPLKASGLYQHLDEYTVGKTIIFADCPTPTIAERDFFIDTIGFGFAYKSMDADFDCPPPLPHVCYYDFSGQPVVFTSTPVYETIRTTQPTTTAPDTTQRATVIKATGNRLYAQYGTYIFKGGYDAAGNGDEDYHSMNELWANPRLNTDNGRLNQVGVWASTNPMGQWIGFVRTINVPTTKTYYIGLAADNSYRLTLNNTLLIETQNGSLSRPNVRSNYSIWSVYPVILQAGDNIIKMEGYNIPGPAGEPNPASFGAEIYNATALELYGMTTNNQLSAVTIFTTGSLTSPTGQYFDVGTTNPPTCENGWEMDTSGTVAICYKDTVTQVGTTNTVVKYTDNQGGVHEIKQPMYYGFSSNSGTVKPYDEQYGISGNWVIPYKPSKIWTIGVTYYKDDVVTSGIQNYVINETITATTLQVPTSAILTTANVGLYQKFENRLKTDPFMHIQPAYIKSIVTEPLSDKISINLTKELNLLQIFRGNDIENTFVADDNIINEQLFISDSITVSLSGGEGNGLYAVNPDNLGPIYTIKHEESFENSVSDNLLLKVGVANYVDMRSLGEGMKSSSSNFNLIEELPGYYLVNVTSFLTFKFKLFFESDFRTNQTIKVFIVNQNGKIVSEEKFTFKGNGTVDERTINFLSQGVFLANERLYLVIEPITNSCNLVRFNKIPVDFDEANILPTTYASNELIDARFRLNFNGGRSINNGYFIEPLISISPVANVLNVQTIYYPANDDNLVINFSAIQPRLRNYNDIIFNQSTSHEYKFNELFGDYFKKNQSFIKETILENSARYDLDRAIGNDKVDIGINFQTRKISDNIEPTAKNLNGFTVHVLIPMNGLNLGNTLLNIDNAEPTKNIVIGMQSQTLKSIIYDRLLNVSDHNSIDVKNVNLYGFNYGVSDYTELNYVSKDNYYNLNYAKRSLSEIFSNDATGKYVLDIDKPIPSDNVRLSTIYQNILEKTEYFDRRIINYKINDIVKITDNILSIDILYVCVRNVGLKHYNKVIGIMDDYIVRGDKSIFVEMTKYNPKNYQICGYRTTTPAYATKTNIVDYLDNKTNITTFTYADGSSDVNVSIPRVIKQGDIVKGVSTNGGNTKHFKLIYNKDLNYNKNNSYAQGDYILVNNIFYWCNTSYSAPGPDIPDARFTVIKPFDSLTWLTQFSTAVVATGNLNVYHNSTLLDSVNTLRTNQGYHFDAKKYNDQPFTAYGYLKSGADLIQPYTQMYESLIPKDLNNLQGKYPYVKAGWEMYYTHTENSFMPLFEVVVGTLDRPAPYDGKFTYGRDPSNRMADNTVLYMNKLYSYIGDSTGFTGTPTKNPSNDPSWEVKDFMLVSKFNLYKEKSNVKIYDGTVSSLTTDMLGKMKMFNPSLTYKNGFTLSNYGSTNNVGDDIMVNNSPYIVSEFDVINEQLVNGLDLVYNAKDANRKVVKQYGRTDLRMDQKDIILDYYPELDTVGGLPLTGEFTSLLRISNPCGQSASVVLGIVMTNNENSLSSKKQRDLNIVSLNAPVVTTPYNLRMMFNQTGKATGTISWSGAASGSVIISESNQFDQALLLQPNKEIVFVITYNVTNKQTAFDYSYLDMINLYPTPHKFGDNLVNDKTVSSSAILDSSTRIETRTITIKSITENHVLRIGLAGIDAGNTVNNTSITNIVKPK